MAENNLMLHIISLIENTEFSAFSAQPKHIYDQIATMANTYNFKIMEIIEDFRKSENRKLQQSLYRFCVIFIFYYATRCTWIDDRDKVSHIKACKLADNQDFKMVCDIMMNGYADKDNMMYYEVSTLIINQMHRTSLQTFSQLPFAVIALCPDFAATCDETPVIDDPDAFTESIKNSLGDGDRFYRCPMV